MRRGKAVIWILASIGGGGSEILRSSESVFNVAIIGEAVIRTKAESD